MRLVAGLFALTLMSSLAFAEEPGTPPPDPAPLQASRPGVGLRVVRVLPETHQALLFDRDRGTHVLAGVGSIIGAYRVEAIEDDAVTLTGPGREVVLAAPEPSWRRRRTVDDETPRRIVAAAPAPADPYAASPASPAIAPREPVDPYAATADALLADPYADPQAPLDPYAAAPVRTATAPVAIIPGEGGIRVASVADPGDEPAAHEATIDAESDPTLEPESTPPIEAAIASATPASLSATTVVLRRAEVQAALADFSVLTRALRGTFTSSGARVETVAVGSVFAKAGLRPGDLVTAVDGVALRSIDDAAELYIRAPSIKTATVQLVREGKPLTLRLAIH